MNWGFIKVSRSISYQLVILLFFVTLLVNGESANAGAANSSATNSVMKHAISLYQQGDFQKSHSALLKLSIQNNVQALFLLGQMYERGDGVKQNDAKAKTYYQRAAKLGSQDAAERVGLLSGESNSIVLEWYLESALDGNAESGFNLAYIYETGTGVKINEALAL